MKRFSRAGFVRRRALAAESLKLMRDMNLRPLDVERPIGQFSGGNQQKAIIGRWIAAGRAHPPVRRADARHRRRRQGRDYALIERLAAEGRSMIVVSSELPEILRVSDRVLVMREGAVAGILERDAISEEAIVALAVPQSASAPLPFLPIGTLTPMTSTDSLSATPKRA